jgi:Dolichyl-phosphate-mannose-protein mannosyltransferase
MPHDNEKQPTDPTDRACAAQGAKRTADYSLRFLLFVTIGFFVARLFVIPVRIFDPDELEHVHTAWCWFRGMLPYKDFFEHHTPWYHALLRPFFRWFDVAGSFESARHFLIFARGVSLVLAVVSGFIIYRIGRLWGGLSGGLCGDRRTGLLSALFLVGMPVCFEKTVEIRPDVLAIPFYLAGLYFLVYGIEKSVDSSRAMFRVFLTGGLGLGAAIMCTQKMLFVLPGLCTALGLWLLFARPPLRSRILSLAAFVLGLCVPGVLTWAGFAIQHDGGAFVTNNFLLNSKWKHVIHEQLLKTLESSWPILILCLVGAVLSVYRFFRSDRRCFGDVLLLGVLFGLIAGILVFPVAHRQYYLMPLPIACLFAAKGLSFLVNLAQERLRSRLLVLATLPLLVWPILDLRDALATRNDQQLARLRYVFENTKPTDVVMDGWEGTGVFRPHAFYYYFLHEESVDMLPRERVDAFVAELERGKIRPRLIALDENLIALGSRFVGFVQRNYASHDGLLYFAKDSSN